MKDYQNRVGEKFVTHEGYTAEIIEYHGKNSCTIKFNDERCTILSDKRYAYLENGQIKNPYHKSVYGIGYLGEGKHIATIDRKMTKVYSVWRQMISRCYSNLTHENQPTYKDCSVIKDWHCFQNFGDWFEENWKPWMDNTWQFDKDILQKGNKIYSPETCCFVPKEINCLFTKCDKVRGDLPIGVLKVLNRFKASISKNGKRIHIGSYMTPENAFRGYKIEKEEYIKEIANKYKGQIDDRVYQAMYVYAVEITD